MTTLVLLHGAWHGAWCWAPVQDELTALGVRSIAVDLPADEPDAGIERYVDVVHAAVPGDEDIVYVAHSLAGLIAPVVAQRSGAAGLVMLAALWPQPGRSPREQARHLPGIYSEAYRQAPMVRFDDGSTSMPADVAHDLLYQDGDPASVTAACARLRPQHWRMWNEPSPLTEWPSVPTVGYACRRDRLLGAEGMVAGAARAAAPLSWLDSGHSPMLSSAGPLAQVLADATRAFTPST